MDRKDVVRPSLAEREMAAPSQGAELRETAGKGGGVFATRPFHTGDLVVTGVITAELARNDAHASQIALHRYVRHGGLMPKVNHSCDPNCGIGLNASGAHDLLARVPIRAGQEITFDYAMRNYAVEHFPGRCQCRTALCRGRITGWRDLPPERRDAYRGLVAPYLPDTPTGAAPDTDS
ncbi:SET domain-containing protein-lysine N-methyltransferase [Streptomyces pinistramenti]|uniref:SET domain-containing protein-lysine N-methyltransferase n=1 Tax=Streptomyces pinistramenti TaxID=2884812 RepID=UPI001D0654E4|nr:SET domain-containing protein-lysine N-methyltransferase [Streptomyces pinistramenti]MCB5906220.1 SET domain-containing protein-lysine N-methyltransferase [Streptomyces pinistramenti]